MPPPLPLVLLISSALLAPICSATIFSNSLQLCREQCLDRNLALPLPPGQLGWPNISAGSCDFDCLLDACRSGCQDLESLSSSCDNRCNSLGDGAAACHQGCRAVVDVFLRQIQELVDLVSVETLVDSALGIRLNWSFAGAQATVLQEIQTTDLRWVAQSRPSGRGLGWRWTRMDGKAFKENLLHSSVFVPLDQQPQPDVELRLMAVWRDVAVVSRPMPQSLILNSLPPSAVGPRAKPSEGPHLQLSASSVAVCWNTDRPTAQDSPHYRLRLFSVAEDGSPGALVKSATTVSNCYLLRQLPSNKSPFRLAIADLGTAEEATLATTAETNSNEMREQQMGMEMEQTEAEELIMDIVMEEMNESTDSVPLLLFTDGISLFMLEKLDDFVMLSEPTKIPFALNESQSISALANLSPSELLVGLSDGTIFWLNIAGTSPNGSAVEGETENAKMQQQTRERVRAGDGVAITQIVVDQLQERFYAVRDKLGILRCQFRTCENSTALTLTNTPNFIVRIAADAWNGFLYYVTKSGDVFSTPLFPLDGPQNYSFSITRRLAELPPASTLEVNLEQQKLLAVTRSGQLMSRGLVDGAVRDERDGWTMSEPYRNVVHSQFLHNRLFWVSTGCGDSHPWESCLFSEEFNDATRAVHLSKYLFSGPVKEFVLLRAFTAPASMVAPSKVGLLLTESEALLSWRPPVSLPFQAVGSSWRSLSYEYILQETNNITESDAQLSSSFTVAQGFVSGGHLAVPIPNPDGEYTVSIRACTRSVCSAQMSSRNRPLRGELARKSVALFTRRQAPLNGDTAAFSVLDLLGREVPPERAILYPQLPTETSLSIAFDNSSNVLYTSSRTQYAVSRRIDGNNERFVSSAHIHQMALIPSRANILLASAYSVLAYRTTSSFNRIVYNCLLGGEECGEVLGVAVEDAAEGVGRLFLLVQLPSGAVQLLLSSSNLMQPFQVIAVAKSNFSHKIRQMAFADERLLVLTDEGLFGTLDLTLQSLNLNFAVRDVQHMLVADYVQRDHRIHFEGPVQFDDKSGQFRWNLVAEPSDGGDPTTSPLLFRLTLFRDSFGGERTSAVSQTNSFLVPPKLLLDWSSRQKFDVVVEALNPWTATATNRSGLSAPTKPPSPPRNIRIYATQQRTVDGTRAIIDLFWEEPKEWNGDQLGYTVNCTIASNGQTEVQSLNETLKGNTRAYSFSVRSGKITCLVFALNDQHLVGPPSTPAEIDGSEFKPLIRLFAIDSTDNLVAIQNWTIEAPRSNNNKARFLAKSRKRQIGHSVQYQAITFVGNELYAVRREPEMSQLALVRLDINQVENVLFKAALLGEFVQIEAMAADWMANRLLMVGNRELLQIQLDQLQQDSAATILPRRLFALSLGAQDAKQLVYDPFTNTAYLLTKNGSLFALDLNKGTESNLELSTGCLRQKTITSIVGEFTWNRAGSPQLFALTWNGLIELKLNAETCPDTNVNWSLFGEKGLKAISLFTVADKVFVFATPSELLVYDRLSASVSQFPVPSPPLRQLLAVSQSLQPFSDRNCFQLPPSSSIAFSVHNEGRTGAVVEVQEPQRDAQMRGECQNISQPQTQYEVHFRKKGTDKAKTVQSYGNKTVVDNGVLDKYTDYEVTVGWLNRYWPAQGQSEAKLLHTGFGFPSAPKDPRALALTPDTVLLTWNQPELLSAPSAEIRYRVGQQNTALANPVPVAVRPAEGTSFAHFSSAFADVVACEANPCQAKVPNLRPSTDYHFWVTALHVSRLNAEDPEATSTETQAHTLDIPGTLRMENVTSDSIMLRWNTLSVGGEIMAAPPSVSVSIQYRQSGVDASWTEAHNSSFEPSVSSQRFVPIVDLRPATTYDYRYYAEYTINTTSSRQKDKKETLSEVFFQQSQQARTKAGTPSAPLDVKLGNEPTGGWTLRWAEPSSDGGEPIQNYAVEYRADSQSEWEIAERGLPADRLYWRVAWAESHSRYGKAPSDEELEQGQFRVRAANAEGFGEFGYTAQRKGQASGRDEGERGAHWMYYIVFTLLAILLLLCVCAYAFLRWKMAKRRRIRAKLHKPICLESIGQQIQFPQSPLKFSTEVQNELKTLPRIGPECVRATRELGMGSFGRVCEGFMLVEDVTVRVAIKYLKDSCEENRVKFLKEAILMNNFDHPNIVRLLGVSMESGENFLVLELMDGGDMRNFLRQSRPQGTRASRVSLRDLIAMVVDVGRGCVYLEKYKHVHRDLAARNCLISSVTSPQRVTKIADFGHARELFVEDYYRFRGGDLLPLRWLSPEVINQGLFASKSDVWAFGVLLWEIVTLGEQPYSNLSNAEVMARLSSGLALDRPPECPNELHEIMRAAWTADSEKRPRFADIQPRLETLRGLPTYQSREPFPMENFFDNSLDSSSTRDSSTTTNGGGDSSTGGGRFEKSESSSTRRPCHLMPMRGNRGRTRGESAFSLATASTALDTSDYEMPRAFPLGARTSPEMGAHSAGGRNCFLNDAFVRDSSLEERSLSRSQPPFQVLDSADESSPSQQRQFGASTSRVSRV